jgi:hypothetical protein
MPPSNTQSTLPDTEITPRPLEDIDWPRLRRQKKWLAQQLEAAQDNATKGRVTGLLNLVDAIQEYACESLGKDPILVWGKEVDGGDPLGEFLAEAA